MRQKHYVHVKWYPAGTWMRLYNFPVSRWDLHTEHKRWLEDVAIPFLNENSAHTFIVIGMTSRTGPEAHNQLLSDRRAREAFQYLTSRGFGGQIDTKLRSGVIGGGERFAASEGAPDGAEDAYFRAVEIWLLKNLMDYERYRVPVPVPATHGTA